MDTFFVAGCQRSGTTLVRLILDSHSRIHCFDEAVSYEILPDPGSADSLDKMSKVNREKIGFKIPRYTEQLLDKQMSDMTYGTFPSFYDNEPVIFLVRDVRDVVVSMKSLTFPDGETWLSKYGIPILKYKMEARSFSKQYKKEIKFMEKRDYADHVVGALYWKMKTAVLFDYLKRDLNVMAVKYERLVQEPTAYLQEMARFINVPWENSLLNHHTRSHDELEEDGKTIGGTNPKLAIHKGSVNKYKDHFDEKQIEEIFAIAKPTCDLIDKLA